MSTDPSTTDTTSIEQTANETTAASLAGLAELTSTSEPTTTEQSTAAPTEPAMTVAVDQADADYAPGETVVITADNVAVGGTVQFRIGELDPGADGEVGTADDGFVRMDAPGTQPWTVTDGGPGDLDGEVNGSITTNWLVDPNGYYIQKTLFLQATDDGVDDVVGTADDTTAQATFTDAANIVTTKHEGQSKTGGILGGYGNGNLTQYGEGDEINFRFSLDSGDTGSQSGQMQVGFSRESATVDMFDPFFALGTWNTGGAPALEWTKGTATWLVAKIGDPVPNASGDEWQQTLQITKSQLPIIDGALDANRDNSITSADDGALLAAVTPTGGSLLNLAPTGTNTFNINVIDGGLDLNNDGFITTADDGRLWYSTDNDNDYDVFIEYHRWAPRLQRQWLRHHC